MPKCRLVGGSHFADGKEYQPGDEVELSDAEFAAIGDKFEELAPEKPQPSASEKKTKS